MSLNAKKRRVTDEERTIKSSKKAKKDLVSEKATGKQKTNASKKSSEEVALPMKVSSSLLKEESRSFPRGGAGAITPLERRQLQVKADQDALLEESRPAKKQKSSAETYAHEAKSNGSDKSRIEPKQKPKPQQPRHSFPEDGLTYKDISVGDLMDGRVTRVEDYAVFVQLRTEIAGRIALTELVDDYNKANPRDFRRNQIIKVRVVAVDAPNKRVNLTCRTSKTLSSTAPVKDPLYTDILTLKPGQIVRGFVKNVADVGLFVIISYNITAFVRVSELSDKFIEDWRSQFEIDQLVRGRIISVGDSPNQVQMSLKTSSLSSDFKIQRSFHDFNVGDIVPGTIYNVADFGAFIRIDDSKNVSGLCHRSEIAETKVEDARKLYNVGDRVKAKILTLKPSDKKISFGLKARYFQDEIGSDEDDDDDEKSGVEEDDESEGVDLPLGSGGDPFKELTGGDESEDDGFEALDDESDDGSDGDEDGSSAVDEGSEDGLDAGAFEWSSKPSSGTKPVTKAAKAPDGDSAKKRKSQKGKIVEDHTGDLDINNPKTTSDFELLLLGTPNDAGIWARYIALKVSEEDLEGARKVAARAIRTIAVTETSQKLELWTVWFNLELQFGNEETVEDVFKQSCEVMDRATIHERFISCCTDVAKQKARAAAHVQESQRLVSRAQQAFEAMKKFPECSKGPDFWIDYGRFLFNVKEDIEAARALTNRAQQSVVDQKYPDLIKGFALLEFNCRKGDAERGRTIFEQLLQIYTKRWDFWEVYIAAESKQKAWDNVRQLYERVTSQEIATKLKKKNVRRALNEWEKFEREHGGEKKINKVRARRQDYEEKLAEKLAEKNKSQEDSGKLSSSARPLA